MPSVLSKMIRESLFPPHWSEGPIYRQQAAWIEEFKSETGAHGSLALEQARRNYDEATRCFESLDAKAAELLKTAGMLATIEGLAVANLGFHPGLCLKLSLGALLVAAAVCALCRRALLRPGGIPIKDLMAPFDVDQQGAPRHIPNPEAWLAASIEGATIAFRDLEEWKARNISAATWLVVIALALLLASVLAI